MSRNPIYLRTAVVMIAACIGMQCALAADEPAAAKPKPAVLCPECGMVFSIRQLEKPIAPDRKTSPGITSSTQSGGMGSDTQTVPLFSFGKGGAHRVQRDPTTRSVWEITIRYDNGQFGFLTHDNEPDFKVGDRVRMVEGAIEPLGQPAR